jgi:MFS family permease
VTHSRAEVATAYGSTFIVSVALGTLPALSSILTSAEYYDLGPTAYGFLFVPLALAAMGIALWGASVSHRIGPKPFMLAGLAIILGAMILLLLSQLLIDDALLVYALLAISSMLIGIGFGFGMPAGMSLGAGFFPERRDRAMLFLNSLVAFGAGTAPILVAMALAVDTWTMMPLALAASCAIVLGVAIRLPLRLPASETSATALSRGRSALRALPQRYWLYGSFMLLYGVVQTLNGNWAALFMTDDIGATAVQGALALTTYWLALGIGRILFGLLDRVLPETLVLRGLPFIAAGAMALVAVTPDGDVGLALLGFGLTGLGCSALFPLGTSLAQTELVSIRAMVSSSFVAFYMVGFGIASCVVGPLVEHAGIDASLIYAGAAVIAVALGILAFVIVRGLGATRSSSRPAPLRG